ncbi:polysaccharide deacetylase family protein [Phytoactinopolyspora limicola]|uniref:polysaccharide deacetylase family protein n=1 Tax=Phytoactinopolyspora limicola TaxID=2715536 RepID=UPI001A9C7C6C|nr:polysaccharide deacetylase family protein [Phytoactinopolyspora limicola]
MRTPVVARRQFLLGCAALVGLPACGVGGADDSPTRTDRTRPAGSPTTTAPPAGTTTPAAEPTGAAELTETPVSAADVDPADYPTTASEWGEQVTGVRTRLDTRDSVVALTFDACGGPNGVGYDAALIDFLRTEKVPATLFVNQRWIDANEATFADLAADPLFAVGNHGTAHRPLSVSGREVYGIAGTGSPAEVIDEIMINQATIERVAGLSPRWFRSGTAYYDEVAVRIAQDLGFEVVNYDVLGDAGATFDAAQVAAALATAQPGSIPLLHMNHPASGTADGVAQAVPALRSRGIRFVPLGDHGFA